MTKSTELDDAAAGAAALSICESLLLALSDLHIIAVKDACNVLDDAAATHRGAVDAGENGDLNGRVVGIIERISAGLTPGLTPGPRL